MTPTTTLEVAIVPGQDIASREFHVGSRNILEAAGFEEVSHPILRRVVVRIDL